MASLLVVSAAGRLLQCQFKNIGTRSAFFHRFPLPFSERHYEKNYTIRGELDDIEFPPDRRKLQPLLRVPVLVGGERVYKYPSRHYDIRGPETVNNFLRHSQFGIQVSKSCNIPIMGIDFFRITSISYTCALMLVFCRLVMSETVIFSGT